MTFEVALVGEARLRLINLFCYDSTVNGFLPIAHALVNGHTRYVWAAFFARLLRVVPELRDRQGGLLHRQINSDAEVGIELGLRIAMEYHRLDMPFPENGPSPSMLRDVPSPDEPAVLNFVRCTVHYQRRVLEIARRFPEDDARYHIPTPLMI